jgi:hypothetical protein
LTPCSELAHIDEVDAFSAFGSLEVDLPHRDGLRLNIFEATAVLYFQGDLAMRIASLSFLSAQAPLLCF